MTIDKQKLQPLLWSVVASWRAGSDALERHTDALDEFLGDTTVEEVALGLLAEIERQKTDIEAWRLTVNAERASRDAYKAELDRLLAPECRVALAKEASHG